MEALNAVIFSRGCALKNADANEQFGVHAFAGFDYFSAIRSANNLFFCNVVDRFVLNRSFSLKFACCINNFNLRVSLWGHIEGECHIALQGDCVGVFVLSITFKRFVANLNAIERISVQNCALCDFNANNVVIVRVNHFVSRLPNHSVAYIDKHLGAV